MVRDTNYVENILQANDDTINTESHGFDKISFNEGSGYHVLTVELARKTQEAWTVLMNINDFIKLGSRGYKNMRIPFNIDHGNQILTFLS